MTTPPSPAKSSFWRITGQALLGMIIGFIVTPVAVFVAVLIYVSFDKVCGTPGDSGGCQMGMAAIVVASALPGAAIGLVVGLVRSIRQIERRRQAG